MNIYVRKVASEGINHHVEHCIFVPASRVLFSSRCPTFRVSLLSSKIQFNHITPLVRCARFVVQVTPPTAMTLDTFKHQGKEVAKISP